jgi:hypothetical protein
MSSDWDRWSKQNWTYWNIFLFVITSYTLLFTRKKYLHLFTLINHEYKLFDLYISVGFWSEWSSYSGCSKTCGIGNKSRSRVCKGGPCSGDTQETQPCAIQECPCPKSKLLIALFRHVKYKTIFQFKEICVQLMSTNNAK